MPKLIMADDRRFKCSACDQFFSPPPVPRGARPWTADEAKTKLAGEFNEHVEKAHFASRRKVGRDTEARGETLREDSVQITLEVPDEIAQDHQNLPRELLESFALEGYRSGTLTEEEVRRLLGYGTRLQVDGFLKEHGVYLDFTLEDLDRDTETSREFSNR